MTLMHTKLPEFLAKVRQACWGSGLKKPIVIRGLENLKTAKLQSLRTGRIERAVRELGARTDTAKVELIVMPRVPETMHTVIVKGLNAQGTAHQAILEVVNIIHPTEDVELEGCDSVDDRRPPLGRH